MRIVVESFKRLYEAGKLTKEQIAEIVEAMRIIAGEIVDK